MLALYTLLSYGAGWSVMAWCGVLRTGLACHRLGWRVMDWAGLVRSVLVWFGVGHTGLVWCSMVVDVLIVGRDITYTYSIIFLYHCAHS